VTQQQAQSRDILQTTISLYAEKNKSREDKMSEHEMQTIVTDDLRVCLTVCLRVTRLNSVSECLYWIIVEKFSQQYLNI